MKPDYIAMLVIGVLGIALGLYTSNEAKKYRARKNAEAELAAKKQPRA